VLAWRVGKAIGLEPGHRGGVSRAFPSCTRSILTEIYLCRACSCQEIEDGNARAGATRTGSPSAPSAVCDLRVRVEIMGSIIIRTD
jgi:hypothetical protein